MSGLIKLKGENLWVSGYMWQSFLFFGSPQVHKKTGTFVESPGVWWCKSIPHPNLTLLLLNEPFMFRNCSLKSSLPALRTLSRCTGPGFMPAASSNSWARGSSWKPNVSLQVDYCHTWERKRVQTQPKKKKEKKNKKNKRAMLQKETGNPDMMSRSGSNFSRFLLEFVSM